MSKAILRKSERLYDLLLKLYPESYRAEFEGEMKFVFSESLKDAQMEHGAPGIIELWARTMIDTGKSLVVQHLEDQKGSNFMKAKNTDFLMQNKAILWVAIGTVMLLMIPLIGTLVSSEWKWGVFDFIFMGALLFGSGLTFVLVARKMNNTLYRTAVGVAAAAGLLLIFINAAVGIIGDDSSANLMYLGVIAVGFIGAVIARFEAQGMAWALFATAGANALVAVIALVFYPAASPGPLGILALNVFFTALWFGSGLLFRRASETGSQVNA